VSKRSLLRVRNERDRQQARVWLDRVPLGWTLIFQPPVRSNAQNDRLWAFLDDVAAQKEWGGKKRSSEDWKDLFTACLRQQEIVPGLEGGIVALGARTSEMSPEEMSDLLQLIETWGVQNNVEFRDTNPRPSGVSAGEEGAAGSASPAQRGNT